MKMKNEETNLVNSFKATRQFMKNSIPEESDEESSM